MSARTVRIGILRLLDSAPVIIAREQGFFAEAGLDVTVMVEPSWANIADKLAYGLLDGAVMLGPLAVAMTVGLRGRATRLRYAGTVSREGNAIVLARHQAPDALPPDPLPTGAAPFAVVHAWSNHALLLRDWMRSRGIDPDRANIITLPPADMVASLAGGDIVGFCAGAPWGGTAERQGVGTIVATSAELAPMHPEKMLVLRGAMAAAEPMLPAALRDALSAATAWCVDPAHHAAVAALLAASSTLDLPADRLRAALAPGGGNPVFMTGAALRPSGADLDWTLARMGEAGLLAGLDGGARAEAKAALLGERIDDDLTAL